MPTSAATALPGREKPIVVSEKHHVLGTRTIPPFDTKLETCVFGTVSERNLVLLILILSRI
jgi:hypothetical protein